MGFVYKDGERPEAIPYPPVDPRTLVPVTVRILKPFYFGKKVLEPGTVIQLPKVLADDMVASGRAQLG